MLLGNFAVRMRNTISETAGPVNPLSYLRATIIPRAYLNSEPSVNLAKSAFPNGYTPGDGAWFPALTGGGVASQGMVAGLSGLSGSAVSGRNVVATLDGVGDLSAIAQLIVAAVANIAGSGDLTGDVASILAMAASLAGEGDVTAALTALGNLLGSSAGSGDLTGTRYATGELGADITPFETLSPTNLANAVWTAQQGAFLYALAHNKVITDPASGKMRVYDSDGTTILFEADLYQDAAGTTPYAGSGAERRDEFA